MVDDIFVHCNNTEADHIQETEQLAEVDRDEDDIVELDDTDAVTAGEVDDVVDVESWNLNEFFVVDTS